MKLTALELLNEVTAMNGLPVIKDLAGKFDLNARKLISCLNRTAEELSVKYKWVEQLRSATLIADKRFAYDSDTGGYDLQLLTGGIFSRFSTNYLYDMTQKRRIAEVLPDVKMQKENMGVTIPSSYTRAADLIIFTPELPLNEEIHFFYQCDSIAYLEGGDYGITYSDRFTEIQQKSVLNDRLLMRGVLSKYRAYEGQSNAEDLTVFAEYLEMVKGMSSPQGIINSFNTFNRFPDIRM